MRCLFIFSNMPLTDNYGGSASRYLQAFLALHELGIEIHVLRLLEQHWADHIRTFEKEPPAHYQCAADWQDVIYTHTARRFRLRPAPLLRGIFQPIRYTFPEIDHLQAVIQQAIATAYPDFILAEMLPAGAVLAANRPIMPWIYGHHDWQYREAQIRPIEPGNWYQNLSRWFNQQALRRAEISIARRSDAVLAASLSEAAELESLRRKPVQVIQTTYNAAPPPTAPPADPMRVIHLGHLGNTATTSGLWTFLEKALPHLNLPFYVIGNTQGSDPALIERLHQPHITLLGHVPDLTTVLRPFDVAVIPYEHNTGVRTKVPLLFNYAQVVVSTAAAVASLPGLEPGKNCIIVSDVAAFPAVLAALATQPQRRQEIGLAARATFERHFTLSAELPRYEAVIARILPKMK